MANAELVGIVEKFAESGWDLIDEPSKKGLTAEGAESATAEPLKAVEQADGECGSCGCEFDPLYKRAIELLKSA